MILMNIVETIHIMIIAQTMTQAANYKNEEKRHDLQINFLELLIHG